MKSLLELYGQQFRNPMPNSDSEDYTTADVFGQMGANKRRAEYDNSLLGMVHNWATSEQRQPVQLPDDAPWLDQAKEAGMRMLNLPNDMAAGGAKTMAHWMGAAGNPEMVEPQDMLAPLGIWAMAGLGGVVPRGAVGSAGGKLANGALDMSREARMQRAKEMGFSDFTGYSDALAKTEKLRADSDAAYRALGPAARELNGYGWDYDRALADARYFHEARPTAGGKEKLDMLTAPGVAEAAAVYRAAQRPLRQMDRTLEVSDAVERMIDASFKERPMDQGGRVYHGAPEKFVTYDAEKARALNNSGGTRSGSEDVAFVSTGRGMAENFGNEVMSLDLKPGRYFDPANDYDLANLAPYINGRPSPNDIWDYLLKSEPNKTNWPWLESEPVVSELRRLGYDGVKMSGAIDTERGLKPHEFYGVFSRGKVTHADPEMNGATFFSDTTRSSLPGLAANALDMSHEARMARAKEMGFDTDATWYHGTNGVFKEFSTEGRSGRPWAKGAVFFSDSPKTASGYAKSSAFADNIGKLIAEGGDTTKALVGGVDWLNQGSSVIPAKINYGKQKTIRLGPEDNTDVVAGLIRDAKSEGYDTVRIVNNHDADPVGWGPDGMPIFPDEMVVFDPSRIRAPNAAFDTAKSNSANLLAADQARGSAVGMVANALDEPTQDSELMRLLKLYGMMP